MLVTIHAPIPKPKLQTNLDTNFLKVIAIICMAIDHMGIVFFPQYPVFRWMGRIVFPLFCYCMTVGLLYTKDIKKYLGRLAIFAIIAQPFHALAFSPHRFWEDLFLMNIFFTLFVTLLSLWGFKERKWWLFVLGLVTLSMFNFDYGITGLVLMLIFYTCRHKPALGALLFVASYLPALFNASIDHPTNFIIGSHAIDFSIFSVFAAPLIFLKTHVHLKISKWFFYIFYPAHLFVIYLLRV